MSIRRTTMAMDTSPSLKLSFAALILQSLLVLTHSVSLNQVQDASASSMYVDPSDMGSYSHSTQRNVVGQGRDGSSKLDYANVDEIQERRTTYYKPNGQAEFESEDSFDGKGLALNSDKDKDKSSNSKDVTMEILETNVNFKEGPIGPCGICPTLDEASVMIYTRRIVASLLRQMNVRSHVFGPNEAITIDLQAELSHEDFTKLNTFILNESKKVKETRRTTTADLDELTQLAAVTDIIGNLLHYVYPEPTITFYEYLQDAISFQYLSSVKFWINLVMVTAVTVLLLVLIRRAIISSHPLSIMFYFFLVFFIISCVSIFCDLYDSARAESHARLHQYDRIPKDCNYNEFGVFDSVGYYIRIHLLNHKDQCVDYHKQMLGETYFHVTPVEAISETLSKLIFHPMEYIGDKSGKFFGGIVSVVPFWLKPFLLVLVFLFGFLAVFRYRIRSPFVTIEPAPRAPSSGYIEGSPHHAHPPLQQQQQGQAIIERAAGDIIRTSTGIDVSTSTDDLEDFIRGDYNNRDRDRSRSVPTANTDSWSWWLADVFWDVCLTILFYLNLLLREVPQTQDLVVDDDGVFVHVNVHQQQQQHLVPEIENNDPPFELANEVVDMEDGLPDYEVHFEHESDDKENGDEDVFQPCVEVDGGPEAEIVFPKLGRLQQSILRKVQKESSSRSKTTTVPVFDNSKRFPYGWVYVDDDADNENSS